jgi:hypothetical protein
MTMLSVIEVPAVKGRRVKFTPERIEQIKNLVERGTSREEIAAILDVTVGSLQVTCSRLGISLRRPATAAPQRPPPRLRLAAVSEPENGNGSDNAPSPAPVVRPRATLSLVVTYRGRERRADLDLPPDVIDQLALEAAFKNVTMAEIVASRIITGKKNGDDA